MLTLINRALEVDAPLETAWAHLAQVERWPSWAKHIRRAELEPPGELRPQSTGVFHLTNGMKSAFEMTEFNPKRNWKWVGPFLWITVHYDHVFEESAENRTRLTFVVAGEGFGVALFGRLFAAIYNRNLDKAIPNLIAEINQLG